MENSVLTSSIETAIKSAGMLDFQIQSSHFNYDDSRASILSIASILPPVSRTKFDSVRAVAILSGIQLGSAIPPIEVDQPPDFTAGTFRLKNGFHRYHLSQAIGFSSIPAIIVAHDP